MNKDKDTKAQSVQNTQDIDDSFTKNRETYSRGKNPNSLDAIKPHQYQKGESGNIGGRNKQYHNLSIALKKVGGEELMNFSYEGGGTETRRERVLRKIWKQAENGDLKFIQLLASMGCLDD